MFNEFQFLKKISYASKRKCSDNYLSLSNAFSRKESSSEEEKKKHFMDSNQNLPSSIPDSETNSIIESENKSINSIEYLLTLSSFNKITNMSYMFYECSSLKSLPHISKWNTSYVIDMSHIFNGCRKLKSIPDISNWNTSNVVDMNICFVDVVN